ncbi:MAG TPA: MlaD family protein, partial [Thermodesulfobacteriota bacterium]|nr:MlaD family protein [Thermodesulfobacteriota bacterium]
MKNMATETKVGIFVVLGILILAYFTVQVGKLSVGQHGYQVNTYLDSAAGLDKNSPVRIAGVEVGKVTQITLAEGKAKVTFHLPNNVQIPQGSKIYVKSAGLLGEKYIEIVPPQSNEVAAPSPGGSAPQGRSTPEGGGAQASSFSFFGSLVAFAQGTPQEKKTPRYVQPGETIPEGGPSVDVDRVLTQLSAIGSDIQSVTRSLSNVLGGPQGEQNIREVVMGAKESMANLRDITQTIDRGEGTLGKLVKDEKLYQEVRATMDNLQQVSQSIEQGKG